MRSRALMRKTPNVPGSCPTCSPRTFVLLQLTELLLGIPVPGRARHYFTAQLSVSALNANGHAAGSDSVSCQNWWPWSFRAEPCPWHLSIYAGLDCLPPRCSEGPSALSSLHLALWPQRRAPWAPEVQAPVNPQGSLASQDSGAAGIRTATSPGLLHSC